MIFARLIVCAAFAVMLVSCRAIGCDAYYPYVTDDETSRELIEWAEVEIFSRDFSKEDFSLGRLVGPGRNGAFEPDSIGATFPGLIEDEIRPIGPDPMHPSGIFIGRMSYRGIIVARTSLNQMLEEANYTSADFLAENGKVALICADAR